MHATPEAKHEVQSGFLLDVVIRKSATILELLTRKDKSLLVRWDTLLVLNLGFHVINGVGGFNLKGDGFAGQSFDEYLHLFNHKLIHQQQRDICRYYSQILKALNPQEIENKKP
ncbi:hypothetical protein V8G54_014138 [Vigna mungo]|uniref:Uncharacterized protein n=1 Tax=Vigna mungo TaxID=3915 RepID=A0AAQ3NK39_VIGMU